MKGTPGNRAEMTECQLVLLEDTLSAERDFKSAVMAIRDLTATDLEAVNASILRHMDSPVEMIPQVAGHLIQAGGKRLRPILTIAAARSFGYDGTHHISLAAAVELIHGATLLHDDVVDKSILRRGLHTANMIWGNKESILVGDFLFSRAFELMVETDSIKVLRILSNASAVIAEGEVLQLVTQKNTDTTFEMYLEVIKAKTAALFAAATQAGAVIAGCGEAEEKAFYDYGLNLGIAYQLVDDALDYSGSEQALGKSVGDDFAEGKMTLPILYAMGATRNEDEKAFWERAITKGDQTPEDLQRALSLMERDDIIDRTLDCARGFADQAVSSLTNLPDNEYTQTLSDLAELSVVRLS
jgi:octaprenyl-diphosphate synthase